MSLALIASPILDFFSLNMRLFKLFEPCLKVGEGPSDTSITGVERRSETCFISVSGVTIASRLATTEGRAIRSHSTLTRVLSNSALILFANAFSFSEGATSSIGHISLEAFA